WIFFLKLIFRHEFKEAPMDCQATGGGSVFGGDRHPPLAGEETQVPHGCRAIPSFEFACVKSGTATQPAPDQSQLGPAIPRANVSVSLQEARDSTCARGLRTTPGSKLPGRFRWGSSH